MGNTITSKMSQKGQVVIPTTMKKVPTALDWATLVKQIPVEEVEIDEHGSYDPKKSPEFHDWMVNG